MDEYRTRMFLNNGHGSVVDPLGVATQEVTSHGEDRWGVVLRMKPLSRFLFFVAVEEIYQNPFAARRRHLSGVLS